MENKQSLELNTQFASTIFSEGTLLSSILQKGFDLCQVEKKIHQDTKKAKLQANKLDRTIQAYFIGPRGQNIDFFKSLIIKAINSHETARGDYQQEDSSHITRKIKNQTSFLDAQDRLQRALNNLLTKLRDLTPPFFSSRYFGHMIWETTIPSIVGNFATMLYNPNNCAFEASPLTTILQIQVLKEFAVMFNYPKMLSFSKEKKISSENSWGHLTCGGTIANCEAMWAARNCRFLTLSVRKFVESCPNQKGIKQMTVNLPNGTSKKLLDLTAWQILNVSNQEATRAYDKCFEILYDQDPNKYAAYQKQISSRSIGQRGLLDMYDWLDEINKVHPQPTWSHRVPTPIVLGSATAHYSLKKSLSILGLGINSFQKVQVDLDSRISVKQLRRRLDDCLEKRIPVLAVIAIVGTTEESTVDNVAQITRMRQQYSKKGLYFHLHIDGAYGGYFVAMLRKMQSDHMNSFSQYVRQQLQAVCHSDSITFDPHKTGYVPYSCGGIIYRNHRLRDNLSFSAPYIYTGAEPNMAIYGVEGSKPGSSVASVYLSIQVLPLVRGGHGQLLERSLMNTKVFTASLYRVKEIPVEYKYENGVLNERFECLLLPRILSQKQGTPQLTSTQIQNIKKISQTPIVELQSTLNSEDEQFKKVYYNLGPDLNIVCFGLNFYNKQTNQPNKSLKKYNEFNRAFIKISKPVGTDISVRMKDLYVSQTEINSHDYGQDIFNDFLKRHGLENDSEEQIIVLIRSTIMNAFFSQLNEESSDTSPNRVFVRQLVQNGCETLLHLGWRK